MVAAAERWTSDCRGKQSGKIEPGTIVVYDSAMGHRGEVFSWRMTSANDKRTYFFNLKENRTGDLYLTVVESKKHGESDFERHQVVVFQEDFTAFQNGIERVFDFVKTGKKPAPPFMRPETSGGESETDRRS